MRSPLPAPPQALAGHHLLDILLSLPCPPPGSAWSFGCHGPPALPIRGAPLPVPPTLQGPNHRLTPPVPLASLNWPHGIGSRVSTADLGAGGRSEWPGRLLRNPHHSFTSKVLPAIGGESRTPSLSLLCCFPAAAIVNSHREEAFRNKMYSVTVREASASAGPAPSGALRACVQCLPHSSGGGWQSLALLGLGAHRSGLCPHHHAASPVCLHVASPACLHVASPMSLHVAYLGDTIHWTRAHPTPGCPRLNSLYLCFQIRSHSEGLRGHEFWGTFFSPRHPQVAGDLEGRAVLAS